MKVLLMDSEGMGSTDKDQKYDTTVFSLAALLCSTLVFNGKGTISEESIAQLGFIANMTQHIRIGSNTQEPGASSTSASADSTSDLERFFPSFLWVLRDFALRLEDEDGDAISPDEYMNNALQLQPGFSADIASRNRVRTSISGFFKNRHCVPLVKPVENDEHLHDLQSVPPSGLRQAFLQGIDGLKDRLFQQAKPKTLGGSDRPVTGPILVQLARHYVQAINGGGVPSITDAWSAATQSRTKAAVAAAKHAFTRGITPAGGPTRGEGGVPTGDEGGVLTGGEGRAPLPACPKHWQLPLNEADLQGVLRRAEKAAKAELTRGIPTGAPVTQTEQAGADLAQHMQLETTDLQRSNAAAARTGCAQVMQRALQENLQPATDGMLKAAAAAAKQAADRPAGGGTGSLALMCAQPQAGRMLAAVKSAMGVFLEQASGPTSIKLDTLMSLGLVRAFESTASALREVDVTNDCMLQALQEQVLARQRECSSLQGQLEAANAEHSATQQQLAQQRAENSDAQARLKARAAELQAARSSAKELQAQVDRQTLAAEEVAHEVARVSKQLAVTRDELQTKRAEVGGLHTQREAMQQQLSSLASAVQEATKAAAASNAAVADASTVCSKLREEQRLLQVQLNERTAQLRASQASAGGLQLHLQEAKQVAQLQEDTLRLELQQAEVNAGAATSALREQLDGAADKSRSVAAQLTATQGELQEAEKQIAAAAAREASISAELQTATAKRDAAEAASVSLQQAAKDLTQRLRHVTELACSTADEADAEATRCRAALTTAAGALQEERSEHARTKFKLGTAEEEAAKTREQLGALRAQLQASDLEQESAADAVTRVSQAVRSAAGHSAALQRTVSAQAAALLRLRRMVSRRGDLQVALHILRGGVQLTKYSSKGKADVRWVRLTASGNGIGWHSGGGGSENSTAERALSTVVPLATVTTVVFGAGGGGVRAAQAAGHAPLDPHSCFTVYTPQRAYCFEVPGDIKLAVTADVWSGSSGGDPSTWRPHDALVTLVHGVRCLLLREAGRNALAVPRVSVRAELLGKRLPELVKQQQWQKWKVVTHSTAFKSSLGAGASASP